MSRVKLANAILDRALAGVGLMRSSIGRSQADQLARQLVNSRSNSARNKALALLGTGTAAGSGVYNSMLHADDLAKLKSIHAAESSSLANMRDQFKNQYEAAFNNANDLRGFNEALHGKLRAAKNSLDEYTNSTFGTNDTDVLDSLSTILK